jgi:glycine dehydrogenase subunit 2
VSAELIFEKSSPGRRDSTLPPLDVPEEPLERLIPSRMIDHEGKALPELSELDVIRHFIRLSQKNFSVDSHFYPLGSCTMKYNPKINEEIAALPGFADIHPYQSEASIQGALSLLFRLEQFFCEITGMERFTLQPAAGAHGELTALMMTRAYFNNKGEARKTILVPDSAHGTNPASASMSGFTVQQVASNDRGNVDMDDLQKHLSEDVACLMMTNPNTLGLFEVDILQIAEMVHDAGGVLYYDGANLNATLGLVRPGDMGFDLMHINPHKTFSTPHGGGGPGAGPVGARGYIAEFLPTPLLVYEEGTGYRFDFDKPLSIGKVKAFYGNFAVLVRAFAYLLTMGREGLKKVAQMAVLNANYLMKALGETFPVPYNRSCMHEFVLSPKNCREKGVKALDIAKRLLDYGHHAPTIYFPLIVEEAMMVEPTETESKETLDSFVKSLLCIYEEVMSKPEVVLEAPHSMPVKRLDDVQAARKPDLRWVPGDV